MSSKCRQNYHPEIEDLINKQINMDLGARYQYLSLMSQYGQDGVAHMGCGKLYKKLAKHQMGYLKKLSKYQYCRGGRFYFADVNQPSEPAQQPSEPAQQPSEPDQQPSEYTQPSAETPQEGKDSLLNSIKFALDMKKALFESLLDMHQTDARSGYYGGGHCGKKRVKKMYKLTLMHTNLERLENHLGADKKIGPSTV